MAWYIARWGKIKQIKVLQESASRVKIENTLAKGGGKWMMKQSSECLITQDFMKAKKFLIDLTEDDINRLTSALTLAQGRVMQLKSLTIEDTKSE